MTTHRERIEKTLAGEQPDRVPVALWRHFPIDDQTPEGLAGATLQFQKTFDFDIIKVTPSSSFCIKDWGAEDEWRGASEGTREYTRRVIENPEDWSKLPVLDPDSGFLAEQLTCLRLLFNELGTSTPIIQTVFNPLSQAKNLVGKENLIIHIRSYPDAVHQGLSTITESIQRYIESVILTGISGIFFAVQHAQFGLLTKDEYEQYGKFYDLQILDGIEELWLNMLHIHGTDIMFDLFLDYPINILNWHDRETSPSLIESKQMWDGVTCGGLNRHNSMLLGTPEIVREEARQAIEQTQARKFILGTGCVLPVTTPYGNIMSARKSVEIY